MHHHIRLTVEARLDLQWWLTFLPHWSGRSLILDLHWTLHTKMQLFTDASGSDGWGAYWSGRWLQDHWSPAQQQMNIAWKELYAIVMAVHTWGSLWQRQKILFHCDNQTVVNIWEKGCSNTRKHPCMANPSLHNRFMQLRYHGVAKSTRRTYQSGLVVYTSFCSCFNINPFYIIDVTVLLC